MEPYSLRQVLNDHGVPGLSVRDAAVNEINNDEDGYWYCCWQCGGEGWISRYEEDPLYYDEDDEYPCDICKGKGGWRVAWENVTAEMLQ